MHPLTCVRCLRPMSSAFATVGEYAYGPKCAKIAGVLPNVSHAPRAPMAQPEVDARQLALDLSIERKTARQGHRDTLWQLSVMAMANGERVEVAEIGPMWLGARHTVDARDLVPQPMAYYHGQIPQ